MGLTSFLKNKAKQTVQNIQAERAYNQAKRLENRDQYDKGYREGQYKRGLAEGSGQIVPAGKQPAQGGKRGGGASWSPDWNAAGALFGGGGGIGGGIDPWTGKDTGAKKVIPMRTTRISKSGAVTIQEPYERKNQPGPYDASNFILGGGGGMPAGASGNRKKERDPSDFIL